MAQTQVKPVINYSCIENFTPIGSGINVAHNTYMKRHLERDGKSVKIVEDGIVDADKEIQSELKNAGLQNILKLQELRYGTLDNAIARASDKGVYADVSNIPTNLADQTRWVQEAQAKIAKLKSELGLSDEELRALDIDKLTQIYTDRAKAAAASNASNDNNGGAE